MIEQRLPTWLAHAGGVAHTRTVREHGFTDHDMRRAIGDGSIGRIRRSWLVTAHCDPRLVSAATAGGRLTCVSAAALRGLWVPSASDPADVHVSVRSTASRVDGPGLTLHWADPPVPLPRFATSEHPVNILFHVARCVPRRDALAIWEGMLRSGVVDADVLGAVRWRSAKARELAAVAGMLSDSGVESHFADLMRAHGIRLRQQVWIDGHPVDGLIGAKLVTQLDGFAHHQARDRRRDLRADARLALRGFTVLRFDYEQVLFEPAYVSDTVLTAMAQGLHRS